MNAYLDSNIFVFASASDELIGQKCASILDWLAKGKIRGITSSLTFDEIFFKIKKLKSEDSAILFTENFQETLYTLPRQNYITPRSLFQMTKILPR